MSKLPDKYTYPAVCTYEENGTISAYFPDLDASTDGDSEEHALYMARELLSLVLYGKERDGDEIPAPSHISSLKLEAGQYPMLVDVYMPTVRQAAVNRAVKRTVTLPAWLNAKAVEHGVNFSHVLQEALKEQLHLA